MHIIKVFTVRITDEQHAALEKRAEELGVSNNAYIGRLIDSDTGIDKAEQSYEELKDMIRNVERKIEKLRNY